MKNFPTLVSTERMIMMLTREYEIIPQDRCQEEGVVFCSVKSDGEEFNLFAKRLPLDESDSSEEKHCEKCVGIYGRDFSPCNNSDCSCHQPEEKNFTWNPISNTLEPETTHEKLTSCDNSSGLEKISAPQMAISHEKDFIESAIDEFRNDFPKSEGGDMTQILNEMFDEFESFLKEKLTEAMKEQKFEDNYENSNLGKKYTGMAYNKGRLAMKEEVYKVADEAREFHLENIGSYNNDDKYSRGGMDMAKDFLAAIREMK